MKLLRQVASHRLGALLACLAALLVVGASAYAVASAHLSPNVHAGNPTGSRTHFKLPGGQALAPAVGPAAPLSGVDFAAFSCTSASRCVAVGRMGAEQAAVGTSLDGGTTWTSGQVAQGQPPLDAVDCADARHCVAVGIGSSATSSDGGQTWSSHAIPTPNTTLLSVSCASSSSCIAAGVAPGLEGPMQGELLRSLDGGATWRVPERPEAGAVGSVSCPSDRFCVAVGHRITVSTDGGATWSLRSVPGGTGVLRTVSCSSASSCVAVGPNPGGISDSSQAAVEVATGDGGQTWSSVSMPAGSFGVSTVSCDASAGCVAGGTAINGAAPALLHATADGRHWNALVAPAGLRSVAQVSCSAADYCLLVGHGATGSLLARSSGPKAWSAARAPLVRTPKGVAR